MQRSQFDLRLYGAIIVLLAAIIYTPERSKAQVIPSSFYELSNDGKTLLQWKGDLSEVNLAADPTLSKIQEIAPYAFLHRDSIGRLKADYVIERIYLPPCLKKISRLSFWCRALKEIVFNKGIEELEPLSFLELPITTLSIPASIKKMEGAFSNCRYLERIEVDLQSLYYVVEEDMLINVDRRSIVLYPAGLLNRQPALPKNILGVEENAFMGAPFIEKIVLETGVQYIGKKAFSQCSSLVFIDFPESMKEIGEEALWYSPIDTLLFRSCSPVSFKGFPFAATQFKPKALIVPRGCESIYSSNATFATMALALYTIDSHSLSEADGDPLGEPLFYTVGRALYLNLPNDVSEAKLFDKEGKIVRIFVTSGAYNLAPGIYFLQIKKQSYKLIIPQMVVDAL